MAKKIFLSLFCFCLCAVCLFGLVGCKKVTFSETTTDTTKVTSNGGSSLIYNGYLYFVNGQLDNNGTNNGKKTMGSIYKVKIQEDGTIAENPSYTKVVDSLVGYDNGSIFIIGNFLYYTTPSTGKDKKGNILYYKTKFMRYDLIKNESQELYTTALNSDSEVIDFAYYTVGSSDVYLLVYEQSNASLTSIKVGQDPTVVFSKTSIKSAIFSQNMGNSSNYDSKADNYVFYTTDVTSNDKEQRGNKVYMVKPDGSNGKQISEGVDISLLAIRAGKLLYTVSFSSNAYVYAADITENTSMGDIAVSNDPNYATPNQDGISRLVSYTDYEQIVFLEETDENGKVMVAVLCYDDSAKMIRYFAYSNGTIVANKNRQVYTFTSSATVKFIQTYTETTTAEDGSLVTRDYIVYTNGSLVYKLRYNSTLEAEQDNNSSSPVQLSTTKVEDANGFLGGKIIGDYIYVFAKDDDSNILLHRISFYTPKELADNSVEDDDNTGNEEEDGEEVDLEIGKATIIGGTNI